MDPRIKSLKSTTFFGNRLRRGQIAAIQETVALLPRLSLNELSHTLSLRCLRSGGHAEPQVQFKDRARQHAAAAPVDRRPVEAVSEFGRLVVRRPDQDPIDVAREGNFTSPGVSQLRGPDPSHTGLGPSLYNPVSCERACMRLMGNQLPPRARGGTRPPEAAHARQLATNSRR